MLSTCHNGEVLDWKFKKGTCDSYSFYIGDIYMGRVFKMGKDNWSPVSAVPRSMSPDGFKSRYYAAKYIHDIWRGQEIKKCLKTIYDECRMCTPGDLFSCEICNNTLSKLRDLERSANEEKKI